MPAQRKALLALIFGVLVISSSAILTDLADAPGSVVSFYRMAIGTVVLAIPFAARWRKSPTLSSRGVWIAVIAGVFFGLDLAAWATGITHAGATIPTLLGNMAPVWVGLGAWLIFKEKLKPGFWLGLAVAIAGMVAVLQLDFSGGEMQVNSGALFGVLSAFFYGAYMLITQKGRDHLDAISFFWIASLSSTITLVVLIFVLGDPLTGYSSFTYWNFIGLGVVVQGIAWLAINYAQGYLPASLVSPTLLIQPVLTAFLAGPLLSEVFSTQQWLGGAAVLLGIIIVYRSRMVRTAVAESL